MWDNVFGIYKIKEDGFQPGVDTRRYPDLNNFFQKNRRRLRIKLTVDSAKIDLTFLIFLQKWKKTTNVCDSRTITKMNLT